MEEVFEPILDNDEHLIKVLKPKKSVGYFKSFFSTIFIYLFFCFFICIGVLAGISEDQATGEFQPITTSEIIIAVSVVVGVLILFIAIQWILLAISYKNIYYGYTNKRILIRKGIIGIDFKSLDIKMIGASNVYVGLFDKILRKNTGTIHFGSMASPLIANNGNFNSFIWANIENPYELYKEIKSYIANPDSTNNENTDTKNTAVKDIKSSLDSIANKKKAPAKNTEENLVANKKSGSKKSATTIENISQAKAPKTTNEKAKNTTTLEEKKPAKNKTQTVESMDKKETKKSTKITTPETKVVPPETDKKVTKKSTKKSSKTESQVQQDKLKDLQSKLKALNNIKK